MCFLTNKVFILFIKLLRPIVQYISMNVHSCYGSEKRLFISDKANTCNTLFNTFSGDIHVSEFVFMGHNVSVLTGTHDYTKKSKERMISAPITGCDIYIEKGVWLGSNSTILGPCRIGENSVIAAGSIVTKDIPNNVLVGGIPARIIKQLQN
jgi:acetyltransferase-like isoleucine patch superfamily enzyme